MLQSDISNPNDLTLSLPLSIDWMKFLGIEDCFLIGGNCNTRKNGIIQVISINKNENISKVSSEVIYNNEYLDCFELGGIPRLHVTFAAIASHHNEQINQNQLSLININALTIEDVSMNRIDFKSGNSPYIYTSISYHADYEALTTSNEIGEVIMWNIETQKQLTKFDADKSGINKVQCLPSGLILSIGKSLGSNSVKLWDPRIHHKSFPIQEYFHQSDSLDNVIGEYTSVLSHPLQDKVICGNEFGVLSVWDSRSSEELFHCQVHTDAITNITIHPEKPEVIITSSADGSVRMTNTSQVEIYRQSHQMSYNVHDILNVASDIVVSEKLSYINGLDCIYGSNINKNSLGIAGSSLGSLWRFELP